MDQKENLLALEEGNIGKSVEIKSITLMNAFIYPTNIEVSSHCSPEY